MRLTTGRRLGGIVLTTPVFLLVFGLGKYIVGAPWGLLLAIAAVVVFWIWWCHTYRKPGGFGGSASPTPSNQISKPSTSEEPQKSGSRLGTVLNRKFLSVPLWVWFFFVLGVPITGTIFIVDDSSSPTSAQTTVVVPTETLQVRTTPYSTLELTEYVQMCMDSSGFVLISNSFELRGLSGNAMLWRATDFRTGALVFARLYGSPKVAKRATGEAFDVMRYWDKNSRWGVFGPTPQAKGGASDVSHLKNPLSAWEHCLTTTLERKWLPKVAS